jgi:hypothetical protein
MRDDDLAQAIRAAAPVVDETAAFERIVEKRHRRRVVRRARVAELAVVAVLVAGSVVVLARDDDHARVAAPVAPSSKWSPITLSTDEGYLRGPLTLSQRDGELLVSVAAYEPDGDGGFGFPPSRVVRFDPRTLEVVDRVELKAEILSVVDGPDGVRFALTRNPDPDGPVAAGLFLKRIAPDGTVTSTDLPPGTTTTGAITWDGVGTILTGPTSGLAFDADGRLDGARVDLDARTPPLVPGFREEPQGDAVAPAHEADGRTWITGRAAGAPAVALLGSSPGSATRVLRLPRGQDASFAWIADHAVLATSNGVLLRRTVG